MDNASSTCCTLDRRLGPGAAIRVDALGSAQTEMNTFFFDNTDPEGFDRVFDRIGEGLPRTLVVVVSKSGGTENAEWNGGGGSEVRCERTSVRQACCCCDRRWSELDKDAQANGLARALSMPDWIGGRTAVMSAVGCCLWRWKV